ncbi:MAG: polyprenyl synthetase family protein [Nanoarchaeota archaeon]
MDELKKLLKENAERVNLELENFLPKSFSSDWLEVVLGKANFDYDKLTCTEAISKPIWNLISRGGKRWRPFLMRLAYESVGGEESIEKFLIIPELIHNGTLIIDDIEDNSDIRRGAPCIHKIFGEDIAINVGNALYYLPLNLIMKSNLDKELKFKIYEVINEELIRLHFGQGMDIYWHGNNKENVTEDQYLQMCVYKTGTLARMSSKLGAILGKASEGQINILGKFAESIGVAFQIQDDILNITNKDWGKDFGEDIAEGKRSLMVIHTLEKAIEKDKEDLIEILKMKTKNKKLVESAIKIIQKYDSINYSKNVAENLIKTAWSELDLKLKDSSAKIKMKMLADYLINRKI